MSGPERSNVWNYHDMEGLKSSVGCLQSFNDKNATKVGSTVLVSYPFHVVLM